MPFPASSPTRGTACLDSSRGDYSIDGGGRQIRFHSTDRPGQPARDEMYDPIWLSPILADKQAETWIDRRGLLGGDGSDHDPAWIKIVLG